MLCPSCGHDNRDEAKFCKGCGGSLALACPSCGAALESEAAFCDECGASMTATPPSRTPTPQPSPALPASFAGGRYAVQRFLGEGGRKRVYLAHDTKLDRDIAFAMIKTEGLDAEGLARVRREAQAMGRLGDHPHIVTIFDVGDEGGEPYIVSQYMAGGDLAAVLDKTEGRRLPVARAVQVATEICRGLDHAHSRGIIHRDLKPGNIWLADDGTAKIGDFGLAVALDRSRLTMAGMMVGTAGYMPPEQAMGGETTAASDLYALGCLLYEMVTGRPPFVGDDAVAVISQHLNTAPVAPSWHSPDCPPGLEALILRLLEKDPQQRPDSASEVRQALTSIETAPAAAPSPAAPPTADAVDNPIYRRTFVGREQELKTLEGAFDAALSGRGSLLTVVGEPGIGKTALCEQLTTYAGMRGGRALVGHCYEEGSLSLPYLPFVEAMRTYTLSGDAEELAQQLGSGAAEVARIVSEIRDKIAIELPPPGNPEEERFRLFQAVTGFLRNAAAVQPLCLLLEDLHDADKGTMDMLVHLARNLGGARLLLVGTYRDVEVDRTHPLSAALAEMRRIDSFQRIPLRGLSPDEVHRMLCNIAGQDLDYALAEAVYRQTEGHPLFIQEMIRYAAESGLIRREADEWVATVDSLLNYIPEGLRDVIGRRLSALSEGCNRILAVAAVIGRDFAVDVLQKVAGASEDELLAALEEASHVSLIEELKAGREVRYRFTHAFFRQTLYEELIAPRRLRLHNEVAKALEEHYAGRVEDHAAELAEHFSHSSTEEDLRKAVQYGELAARRAAAVYAHGEAVRLLEQTLQVQEVLDPRDEDKRCDLLLALGQSLLGAGEPERVVQAVAPEAWTLAERLGDRQRGAAAGLLAAWALVYHGSIAAIRSPEWGLWARRLDADAEPETAERVVADLLRSWSYYGGREMEPCWRLRLGTLEMARKIGYPEILGGAILAFLESSAPPTLHDERLRVAREFASLPRAGMRPSTLAGCLAFSGLVLLSGDERALAESVFAELDEYAERVSDPYVLTLQAVSEAYRLERAGSLEEAVAVGDRLVEVARTLGAEALGGDMAAYMALRPLLDMGRFEEALASLPHLEPFAWGDAVAASALAQAGRLEEARRELSRVMSERAIGPEEDWTDMPTLVGLLHAAVLTGEREGASVLSGRLAAYADRPVPQSSATTARLLGLAALLLDDPQAAWQYLGQALQVAKRLEHRPETAQVRLALARVLFEHHPEERREALEHLNFAVQEFQAMKMQPALEEAMRLKLQAQGVSSTDIQTSIDAVAASVYVDKPDLRPHAAPDGTVTILFSDIEGSTALNERVGDKRWMELLREHNAIVREKVKAHGGFEVKSEGDGFMLAFQSARRAIDCAIAIQQALAQRNQSADEPIRVRMGLHTGEAIKEGDDFFGKHVNLAARIAGQAKGGEVLVSSLLKELTDSVGDIPFGEGREVELKGLAGSHRAFALEWE
jgi:class 3 adenylate cyclase/tetratricopeptide (TPR) repeat protein